MDKKEEEVAKICQECMNILSKSISSAIAHGISKGYELGFKSCLEHFEKNIKV